MIRFMFEFPLALLVFDTNSILFIMQKLVIYAKSCNKMDVLQKRILRYILETEGAQGKSNEKLNQ